MAARLVSRPQAAPNPCLASQSLISAAVRLVPLGQTDGLAVLAALEPVIATTAAASASLTLEDLQFLLAD